MRYERIAGGGGGGSTLIEKSVIENGVYNASDDSADGYCQVTVNVPPTLFRQLVDKSIRTITAEDLAGVTSIGYVAFSNCYGLTDVTLPDSVTYIGSSAFRDCHNLGNINIPDGVTNITDNVLRDCSRLTSITLPDRVRRISSYAFSGCRRLNSITIKAITPPTLIDINSFDDTNSCPIYVPAESVIAYRTATNWSSLASRIQAIPA